MTATSTSLIAVAALTGALVLGAMATAARAFVHRAHDHGEPRATAVLALASCAMAFVVIGCKLVTISKYALDLPFWDQWWEAGFYAGLDQGTPTWAELFGPHNEHRIVFSRVVALLLVAANRQWDNRLQALTYAVVHAAAAVVLLSFVARSGRRWEVAPPRR